jgi:peptidylprolyl isomerase
MDADTSETDTRRLPRRALALALALLCADAYGQDSAAKFLTPPPDAEKLASGVYNQVLTPGTGKQRATEDNIVAVHFVGWAPEGGKLYSSYDLGKPLIVGMWAVSPDWQDTLLQMVSGEKRRIWLPEHLVAQDPAIQGASIFDLELLGILREPTAPEDLAKAPADAQRTPSGAFTRQVSAGSGEEHPGPDSLVLVSYVGWTADGKVFDSSHRRGRPTAFPLDQVMSAFAEAVQLMVVGEKRRIWIPGPVAGRNWVGSPKGPLVFEVDLIKILPKNALQRRPAAAPPPPQPGGEGPS